MAFLKKTAATPAPVIVPSPAEALPEFKIAADKQRELLALRSTADAQLRSILRGRVPAGVAAHAARGRGDRAAELLGDVAGSDTYQLAPSRADIEEQADKLREQLGDIDAALAILKTKIPPLEAAASQAVADLVRDGYNSALKRTALALVPALAAHREVLRIVGELNDQDVKWSGKLTQPSSLRRALGEAWDRDTAADRYIAEVVAAGLVTAAEIKEAANA